MTSQVKSKKQGKSPIPGAKQFTSEYQPSPKRKSEGVKKHWEYRKSRQQFFEAMCEVKLPGGGSVDFWSAVRERFQFMILDKKSGLKNSEKIQLMMFLCKEFMPGLKQIDIDNNRQAMEIKLSYNPYEKKSPKIEKSE